MLCFLPRVPGHCVGIAICMGRIESIESERGHSGQNQRGRGWSPKNHANGRGVASGLEVRSDRGRQKRGRERGREGISEQLPFYGKDVGV